MARVRNAFENLRRKLAAWRASRSGNAVIMFGIAIIPTVGIVGIGMDYYSALSLKARLDAAADSAAIAGITTAQTYLNQHQTDQIEPLRTTNATAAGQAQALKVFAVNAGATALKTSASPSVTVTRTLQTLTAQATYTARMPTNFGKLFGQPTFNLAGSASSSLTMGKYLDFYLLLDVSGSMGLATSTADQQTMNASSATGNCAFACHFAGQTQAYDFARSNKIALRVDSVGYAVTQMITTANATKTLDQQFRIGIYPFIVDVMQAAALSSTFTTASTVGANLGSTYLDTGLSNSATTDMGSGGTHLDSLFSDLYKLVGPTSQYPSLNAVTNGDGSSQLTPKPFIFIVTDGMNNSQVYKPPYSGANPQFSGSNPQPPTNFGSTFGISNCQVAKNAGITVAILYIPYLTLPIGSSNQGETIAANNAIPSIPSNLQSCASNGFFFTANTATDINNALQAMFFQALAAARLTN